MAYRSRQLIIFLAGAVLAFGNDVTLPDLTTLSLDQLVNIKVTSFTGKQQKLSQVAGAVYVITQEQIARSGLTRVPELLRLAPGIDVAQVNGNQWSISARGSTGVYSNKLLVLIDGRSIYSPIFSGVYWELGMPLLDDIERIEVIRGPGATIWGANAVLGVINIITKTSKETKGTTISAGGGSSERAFGSVRFGGTLGASASYRAYFGGSDNAPLSTVSGGSSNDSWDSLQGGFRLDGSRGKSMWMLEGDLFRTRENEIGITTSAATLSLVESPSLFNSAAANISGEWRRRIGETGELRLQSYYDYANRPPLVAQVATRTWDTALQYSFTAGRIHNLSVGGGERLISGSVTGFVPVTSTYSNVSAFAQDELHFAHDMLLFTVGAKLEHNHFGGWDAEPSANLLWTPAKKHSLWISAARALRTPNLFEKAANGPLGVYPPSAATQGLPAIVTLIGAPAFSAESVKDFEAGYRAQISKRFSVDFALFYDFYSGLRAYTPGIATLAFSPVPHAEVSAFAKNATQETGKGGESSVAWQALPDWKLEGSYSYVLTDTWLSPSSAAAGVALHLAARPPPRNIWRLQSYVNLTKAWKVDSFLYWTSPASPLNTYGPDIYIPAYTRLDVRLGYKVGPRWQLSLAGQNLLQRRHSEGTSELLTASSYVNRGFYLKSTWQF